MRRNKTLNLREINTTYWRRQHSWERNTQLILVGLSKERPILGDHAKAHIFGLRSENTPIKPRRSTWKAHEKRRFSKDHLQGIVTPMFINILFFFIILNSDWQHVTFGKIRQMTLFCCIITTFYLWSQLCFWRSLLIIVIGVVQSVMTQQIVSFAYHSQMFPKWISKTYQKVTVISDFEQCFGCIHRQGPPNEGPSGSWARSQGLQGGNESPRRGDDEPEEYVWTWACQAQASGGWC